MKRKVLSVAVQSAVAIASMPLVLGGQMAMAQDESEELVEEIVVTGSRLSRPDIESVSPMTIVDSEEFVISGNINVEQKLAELPSTNPSFGSSSNNPGDGTARVDLRGLGSFRTLVLVNGRRYIPSTQTGVVDLNTVPGTLIKQVDVVTGGASAVYGSDALAGVVNFQLKDDYEGFEVTGLYDVTSEGDAERYNIDFTLGGNFDDGRGNAVLYASYSKRNPLFQGERDFTQVTLRESGGELVPGGSTGIPGTRAFNDFPVSNPDGIPNNGDETFLGRFEPDGTLVPFRDPEDRFNFAPDNYLQLPQERYLVSAMGHYDIKDNIKAYMKLAFARNKVPQQLAPTPAFISDLAVNPESAFFTNFPNAADIFFDFNQDGLTNQADIDAREAAGLAVGDDGVRLEPTYTAGDAQAEYDAAFASADTNGDGLVDNEDNVILNMGRRMVENGPRQAIDTRNAFRILTGISGDITDNWSFDAYYSKSVLEATQLLENDVSRSRFRQAALVTDDATACQDPSNGCAPLNIFGAGNISQEAIDFIKVGATNATSIEQEVFQANVAGMLGALPSANNGVGLLVGVEHRADESSFRPDTFLSSGDVLGFNAGEATEGEFSVLEFFAEVNVPIIEDAPGANSLEFWGAYRHSDYSNIGGVDSFATALNYEPVGVVKFRVGYQEAVRAPNVSELFLGQSNGFPGASDPCAAGNFDPSTTSSEVCIATGVPANRVGGFTQANPQIEGRFGGNPELEEETSNTFTIGAVIQPMEGLDISLDYYSIEIENAIDQLGGGVANVLNLCYNTIQDADSPFCQAITRRGDGNVEVVNVLNENIGLIETSGVDLNIRYATELGDGSSLSFNFVSTYLDSYDVTPVAELPDEVNNCAGAFGDICDGNVYPELAANLRTTWVKGPLTLSGLLRYIGESEDDRIVNDTGVTNIVVSEIEPEMYLDLSAAYQFSEALRVNFGIINALDTEPTALGGQAEQGNTFPETYNLLGPRVFLSASYKFR